MSRAPRLRGCEPARDPLELALSGVLEELGLVVAGSRYGRVDRALHGRGAEGHRTTEELGLLHDRRRCDLAVADLVQPLDQGQRLTEADGDPRIRRDLRLPVLLEDLEEGRHALVREVEGER